MAPLSVINSPLDGTTVSHSSMVHCQMEPLSVIVSLLLWGAVVNIALYCSKTQRRVSGGGVVVGWGGANRFSCQTHNQVALGCFWVGLLLLGLALGL